MEVLLVSVFDDVDVLEPPQQTSPVVDELNDRLLASPTSHGRRTAVESYGRGPGVTAQNFTISESCIYLLRTVVCHDATRNHRGGLP